MSRDALSGQNIRGDERIRTLPGGRMLGLFGHLASSFTLAWMASHRGRLRTILIGGRRLSIILSWDTKGREKVERDQDTLDAIYTLTYGVKPSVPVDASSEGYKRSGDDGEWNTTVGIVLHEDGSYESLPETDRGNGPLGY